MLEGGSLSRTGTPAHRPPAGLHGVDATARFGPALLELVTWSGVPPGSPGVREAAGGAVGPPRVGMKPDPDRSSLCMSGRGLVRIIGTHRTDAILSDAQS